MQKYMRDICRKSSAFCITMGSLKGLFSISSGKTSRILKQATNCSKLSSWSIQVLLSFSLLNWRKRFQRNIGLHLNSIIQKGLTIMAFCKLQSWMEMLMRPWQFMLLLTISENTLTKNIWRNFLKKNRGSKRSLKFLKNGRLILTKRMYRLKKPWKLSKTWRRLRS